MPVSLQAESAPADLRRGVFKLSFKALGTHCMVQFRTGEVAAAKAFRAESLAWLRSFEATFSRFTPGSLLSRINAAAGRAAVPIGEEMEQMLVLGEMVYSLSGGVNDPTSLPLTRLWDAAAGRQQLPSTTELSACLELVGWGKVERSPGQVRLPRAGMALDFGGFGKEFAVDRVLTMATRFGIEDILVDLGRDIATCGHPSDQPVWVVGIEDAAVPDRPLTRTGLSGQAMASSGNYRRYRVIGGQQYGHLIDPRSGAPASTSTGAVSCVAAKCVTAGVFSQAAFILGPEDGLRLIESQRGVEGLIQTRHRNFRTRHFCRYEIPHAA